VTRVAISALLGLLALAGCGGPGTQQPAPTVDSPLVTLERPPPNSPGTVRGLGSHLFEATYDRRGDRLGIHPSKEWTARLVWAELDYYEYARMGPDGEVTAEEVRLGSALYRRTSSTAPYRKLQGTPGDSIILLRTLSPWEGVLSPFGDQVVYERLQDSTVQGRPVRVYKLSLGPPALPPSDRPLTPEAAARLSGMTVTPISLSGLVYVDIETGNRLLAEVEGRYVPVRGANLREPTDEVLVTYRESRSPTQLPPDIVAPPEDEVVERRPGIILPRERTGGRR